MKKEPMLELMGEFRTTLGLEDWEPDTYAFASKPGRATGQLRKGNIILWYHDEEKTWSATHCSGSGYLVRYPSPKEALRKLVLTLTRETEKAAQQAREAATYLVEVS